VLEDDEDVEVVDVWDSLRVDEVETARDVGEGRGAVEVVVASDMASG
jgi:hypothetical protein